MERRPASDFGGPIKSTPPESSTWLSATVIVPAVRSTRARVRAASSPKRRPANAAVRTSARKRGSTASASAQTCAMVATGRSGVCSTPAPLMAQGLRTMSSSATAVFRIARSNR